MFLENQMRHVKMCDILISWMTASHWLVLLEDYTKWWAAGKHVYKDISSYRDQAQGSKVAKE